ncbi:MAG: acyltransferase family protein [Janthinobacterium lividum]
MLIVAGVVGLKPRLRAKPSAWLLLLGNASCSLYLTHIIAISATAVVWQRLRLPMGSSPGTVFIPVAFTASVGVSIMFYRLIETPILKMSIPRTGHRKLAAQVFQCIGQVPEEPATSPCRSLLPLPWRLPSPPEASTPKSR